MVAAKDNGGVGYRHHRRGGYSSGGGGGGASGAGAARGAAEGATLVQQPGQWPQLWWRQRRAEEWRERTLSVGRLVNLLLLFFVPEHGPQRGGRGSRQEL